MRLLELLDASAKRRTAKRLHLIDRGLDGRSLLRDAIMGTDPRFIIAAAVIGLFAWAFDRSQGDERSILTGALVAAFAGAWGYYLGSSSGASKAGDRQDKALEVANRALEATGAEPDVLLKPGETAQAEDGRQS